MLVFQEDPSPGYELVWYDRQGRRIETLGTPPTTRTFPSRPTDAGSWSSGAGGTEARPLDLRRCAWSSDAVSPRCPRPMRSGIWSPDGGTDRVRLEAQGHGSYFSRRRDRRRRPEVLIDDAFDKSPLSWSPDGRFILFSRRNGQNPILGPAARRRSPPFALPQRAGSLFRPMGAGSPILHRVGSNGGLRRALSGPGRGSQISTGGGSTRAGVRRKEIFYLGSCTSKLMVASISWDGITSTSDRRAALRAAQGRSADHLRRFSRRPALPRRDPAGTGRVRPSPSWSTGRPC